MKVRIKRDVLAEIVKTKLQETWSKPLYRWDELNVEKIDVQGKYANLTTYDEDIIVLVPVDAYEVLS
jgi:hypothetical protein